MKPSRGKPPLIAMHIIRLLAQHGPMERREISAATGAGADTVKHAVWRAMRIGFVVEARESVGDVPGTVTLNPKRIDDALDWVQSWQDYIDGLSPKPEARDARKVEPPDEEEPARWVAPPGFVQRAIDRVMRIDVERAWRGGL